MEKRKKKKIIFVPYPMNGFMNSPTDPSGSYTGIPIVSMEEPVQDADDL